MMAAMVVPLAWRSNDSTVSCFVGDPPLGSAMVRTAALSFDFWAVVFLERVALGARLIPRDGFAVCLVSFDFRLLVAIRPSLVSTTACATDTATSPAIGRGEDLVRDRV